MRWATRLALFIGGAPARARVVLAWIAVLPVVVVLSKWTGSPLLPMWISAGVAGFVALFLTRGGELPVTSDEKRLAARAVLTGAGTGDPDLDGYALGLLDARKRIGQQMERIALGLVTLSLLASQIVASITSGAVWLLMLPLEATLVAVAVPYLALDIDENIRRLEAAIPPPNDPP